MHRLRWTVGRTALFALAAAALAAPAWAADSEAPRVEKVIRFCSEGEDCGHLAVLAHGGDGKAFHWLAPGPHGFLGVELVPLTPELRAHFGVPEDAGVMVAEVLPDSPAERAGLEVGDIVTAVEGESVASASDLAGLVRSRKNGESVAIELWRAGRLESATATLEEREGPSLRAWFNPALRCARGGVAARDRPAL